MEYPCSGLDFPSAQEGAEDPFILIFMTITRKNYFPSLHSTARSFRRQQAEKGNLPQCRASDQGTKLISSECSSSLHSLLMVKELILLNLQFLRTEAVGPMTVP